MKTERERFDCKVNKTNSCWHWIGYKNAAGYGTFWFAKKNGYAHRYAHITFNGQVPNGHEVDHLCKNPSCVNPAHLRTIPLLQNRRKGMHADIEMCRNGHSYDAILVGRKQKKQCRLCKLERLRNWRRSKSAPATQPLKG